MPDPTAASTSKGDTPVRPHPCVVQYGYCDYGSRCRFATLPGDTCLMYLRGTCTRRGQCWYRHDVGPGGCIEKGAPVVLEGKGVVKKVSKGLAVVARPDAATQAKLVQDQMKAAPMVQEKKVERATVALEIDYGAETMEGRVRVATTAAKVTQPKGGKANVTAAAGAAARPAGGGDGAPDAPHHPLTEEDLFVEGEYDDADADSGYGCPDDGVDGAGYYDENGVWFDTARGCFVMPDGTAVGGAPGATRNPYAGGAPAASTDAEENWYNPMGGGGGFAFGAAVPGHEDDGCNNVEYGWAEGGDGDAGAGYGDQHFDPFAGAHFTGFLEEESAAAVVDREKRERLAEEVNDLDAFPTLGAAVAKKEKGKGKRVQAGGGRTQELKVVTRAPRSSGNAPASAATSEPAPAPQAAASTGSSASPSHAPQPAQLKATASAWQPPVYRLAATSGVAGATAPRVPGQPPHTGAGNSSAVGAIAKPAPKPAVVRAQQPVGTKPAPKKLHPCKAQLGSCRYGAKCQYAALPADACLMFLQGRCKFGEGCRNKHVRS